MNMKSELVKGSLVLFVFMNLYNFLNYAFQFFMARVLSVADYGVFVVLMSLVYVLLVPSESIQLVTSRYSSLFFKEKNLGKIKSLFVSMTKKSFKISLIVYLIFIPISFFLSWFLNINVILLLLIGSLLFFAFLAPVNRGILQGQRKFNSLGVSILSESVFKITIGIALVLLGMGLYGAISGVVLGLALSFLFSFLFIGNILKSKKEGFSIAGKYSYSVSVFFSLFILFSMLMLDMILVKRFFSAEVVGAYAVISLLGKTIFFATVPISKVMFPMTSHSGGKSSKRTFFGSMRIVLFVGLFALVLFILFPKQIVSVLFSSKYLEFSSLLWLSGIAFIILSLTNLSMHRWLSLKKVENTWVLALFPVIQIILLSIFNKSIIEFMIALIVSFMIFFIGILAMILKNGKN